MTEEESDRKIPIDQVEGTDVSIPNSDPESNEIEFFAHAERTQKTNLGLIGKVWGSKEEKPGNISGTISIIVVVFLIILTICCSEIVHFDKLYAGIFSIITLTLGYLFGRHDNNTE